MARKRSRVLAFCTMAAVSTRAFGSSCGNSSSTVPQSLQVAWAKLFVEPLLSTLGCVRVSGLASWIVFLFFCTQQHVLRVRVSMNASCLAETLARWKASLSGIPGIVDCVDAGVTTPGRWLRRGNLAKWSIPLCDLYGYAWVATVAFDRTILCDPIKEICESFARFFVFYLKDNTMGSGEGLGPKSSLSVVSELENSRGTYWGCIIRA